MYYVLTRDKTEAKLLALFSADSKEAAEACIKINAQGFWNEEPLQEAEGINEVGTVNYITEDADEIIDLLEAAGLDTSIEVSEGTMVILEIPQS